MLVAAASSPALATTPDPPAALPPPQVTLNVLPATGGAPWRLSIENKGEGPVRIPADPRLLVLELTPAATSDADPKDKKKAVVTTPRCILPDGARPTDDDGGDLVIPPKRSWTTTFDPLFYCFGQHERAALVPGTTIKAYFGWPAAPLRSGAKPPKTTTIAPPFAVAPVGASIGKIAPAKAIEADAVTIPEALTVANPNSYGNELASSTVTLSVPEAMDVARGSEVSTTVTLTNGSDRPITLLYRPDMMQFSVSGPAGTVSCGSPRAISAPIRELFVTVPVKGKTAISVLLTTTCPAGTFDDAGIYRVFPRLDTTNASGRVIGMKTWDGLAVGTSPLLLRVRSPHNPPVVARPTVD